MQLRKKLAIGVAVTASLAVGTAAFAFWSTSGSGAGSAVTGAPEGVTITGNLDAEASQLYPGASFPLTVTLTNTNPYAVTLGPISGEVTVLGDDGDPDINDVCQITVAPNVGATTISASSTATAVVTVAMFNDPLASQDICKGRLVNIAYSASAAPPPAP